MIRILLSSLLLVPMSACATIPTTVQSTLLDEKALYASEVIYTAAASSYLEAVKSGVLTGEKKTIARQKLLNAYDLLIVLRRAHQLGDNPTFNNTLMLFKDALA